MNEFEMVLDASGREVLGTSRKDLRINQKSTVFTSAQLMQNKSKESINRGFENNINNNNNNDSMPIVFNHSLKDLKQHPLQNERQSDEITKDPLDKLGNSISSEVLNKSNRSLKFVGVKGLQLVFHLECLQVFCDIVQYIDLKVIDGFSCDVQEIFLLVSLVFCAFVMGFLKIISSWRNNLMLSSIYPEKKGSPKGKWRNTFVITVLFYVLIIDVLRYELFLYTPVPRAYTLFLTLVVNSTLLAMISPLLTRVYVVLVISYLHTRMLIKEESFVYLFVNSAIVTIIASIKCFRKSNEKDEIQNDYQYEQNPVVQKKKESKSMKKEQQQQQQQQQQLQQKQPESSGQQSTQITRDQENNYRFCQRIVSMMPQGVLIVDSSETLIYANKTTKKILSCSSSDTILQSLKQLIVKNSMDKHNYGRDQKEAMHAPIANYYDHKRISNTIRTMVSQLSAHSIRVKKQATSAFGGESVTDSEFLINSNNFNNNNYFIGAAATAAAVASPNQAGKLGNFKVNEKRYAKSTSAMRVYQKSMTVFSSKDPHTYSQRQNSSVRSPQTNSVTDKGQQSPSFQNNNQENQFEKPAAFQLTPFQTSGHLEDYMSKESRPMNSNKSKEAPNNFDGMSVMDIVQVLIRNQAKRQKEQVNDDRQMKVKRIGEISLRHIPHPLIQQEGTGGEDSKGKIAASDEEQENQREEIEDMVDKMCLSDNQLIRNNANARSIVDQGSGTQFVLQGDQNIPREYSDSAKDIPHGHEVIGPLSPLSSSRSIGQNLFTSNHNHLQNSSSGRVVSQTTRQNFSSQKRRQSLSSKVPRTSTTPHLLHQHAAIQPSSYSKDKFPRQQSNNLVQQQQQQQNGSSKSISGLVSAGMSGSQGIRQQSRSNSSSWHTKRQLTHYGRGLTVSGVPNTIKQNTELAQNSLSIRINLNDRIIEVTFLECEVQSRSQIINLFKKGKGNEEKKEEMNGASSTQDKGEVMILIFLEDVTNEVYTRKLEELNVYKMRMLNSLSHELKTPLNCSMGMLEGLDQFLLRDSINIDPVSVQYMKSLIEPAKQSNALLLSMIRDLLDLGTLEIEPLQFSFTTFNLREMLEDHCNVMKSQAQVKEISIELEFVDGLNEEINSDETRLSQIIFNLLSNSLKFTGKCGKIILRAEPAQDDNVKISVEDNGIGISHKQIQSIFSFFQGANESFQSKSQIKGIGLGLSACYHLVKGLTLNELRDRPINVISEERKGSIFSFILKNQEISSMVDSEDYENNAGITSINLANYRLHESEEDQHEESQEGREIRVPYTQPRCKKVDYASGNFPKKWTKEMSYGSRRRNDSTVSAAVSFCEQEEKDKGRDNFAVNGLENVEVDYQEEESHDNLRQKFVFLDSQRFKQRQGSYFSLMDRFLSDPDELTLMNQQGVFSQRDNLLVPMSATSEPLSPNSQNPSLMLAPVLIASGAQSIDSPTTLTLARNLLQKQQQQQVQSNSNINIDENSASAKFSTLRQIQAYQAGTTVAGSNFTIASRKNMSRLSQNGLLTSNNTSSIMNVENEDMMNQQQNSVVARGKKGSQINGGDSGDILIVDDIQFNLITLQNFVKKYAFSIDFAHDGQDAVDKVVAKYNASRSLYRIIFMDLQMPVKDGFEATEDIRKYLTQQGVQQIPIVATSAFGESSFKEQAKKVGMTDYIEKPIKQVAIDKVIQKYVLKPSQSQTQLP